MRFDMAVYERAHSGARGLLLVAAAGLLAGGCSVGPGLGGFPGATQVASAKSSGGGAAPAQGELDKAIEYWGGEYKKHPHSLKAALSYARNLKAAGRKRDAFSVVQSASLLHGDSKELASEYGRMALELGQVQVAMKVLAAADDPAKPDWRVISARGTAMAKQGKYAEAVPFYQRALSLAPEQPSVLNNLALTYVADGKPAEAEKILRSAAAKSDDPKVRQNLALVLSLQGKYAEGQNQAAAVQSAAAASADTQYLREMVKAPAVAAPLTPAVLTRPTQSTTSQEPSLSAEAIIAEAKAKQQTAARPRPGTQQAALRSSKGTNAVGADAPNWPQSFAQND